MSLTPGARLGPYGVIAPIGHGGMGDVYRAHDTKLNRDVALKVLPDIFANAPDRLARFQREAQVLASLNHPNIGGIYGLEEADGVRALVLELVEGPTLADRIAEGPIVLDEALPIAQQIAEALEAAHEHGTIHRDLKPANIKVRPDGIVKVLDFGLAKALDPGSAGSDLSQSPTLATSAVGVIMGTAAYMSPEQAKGKPVDKRADIWAFGCVLYEMLTGQRTFAGDSMSDVLASVLAREPEWSALPAEVPSAIRQLMQRCLRKDRAVRLHDIADARVEIKEARSAHHGIDTTPTLPPAVAFWRRAVPWTLSAVMGITAVSVAWIGVRLYLSRSAPRTTFTVEGPAGCPLHVAQIIQNGLLLVMFDPEGIEILEVRATQDIDLNGGAVADESRQHIPFPFRPEDAPKLRLKSGQRLRIYIQEWRDLKENEVSLFQDETIYSGGCGERDRIVIFDRDGKRLLDVTYRFGSR